MRCKYCGSNIVHEDTQHKTFSSGKAVAGAVMLGPLGAAAGMIGKDQKGYRCGACGAFMDAPMDPITEGAIDRAIADAENGRDTTRYQSYKKQYPNIQATIPPQAAAGQKEEKARIAPADTPDRAVKSAAAVKREYRDLRWVKSCPVYVDKIILSACPDGDMLSLVAWNQGKTGIRSAYFQVTVYDDTGDVVGETQCVYQNVTVDPGKDLPREKEFALHTDLAYRVLLRCEKVALDDGSVWRAESTEEALPLPPQLKLREMDFPRLKYALEEVKKISKTSRAGTLYLPVKNGEYWQCVCGQPVMEGEKCPHCGAELEKLDQALSQERLREIQQKRVRKTAAGRAKETMRLYQEASDQKSEEEYSRALELRRQDSEQSLEKAASIFQSIAAYKDSAAQAKECLERITVLKEKRLQQQEQDYAKACQAQAEAEQAGGAQQLKNLAKQFASFGSYKDCKERRDRCEQLSNEIRARQEEERARLEREQEEARLARMKKILIVSFCVVALLAVIVVTVLVVTKVILPANRYKTAEELLAAQDYDGAAAAFQAAGNFRDAAERVGEVPLQRSYDQAEELLAAQDYDGAIAAFQSAGDYKDAPERKLEASYLQAEELLAAGDQVNAAIAFGKAGDYQDAHTRALELWNQMKTMAAGSRHTVGLRSDGTVVATGYNSNGQCNVSDWTDIMAVAAGYCHTVGLRADSTVVAVGKNDSDQCDVSDWTDIVAVAAGSAHTVGLRPDGTVVAIGRRDRGQCATESWTDVVAVAAGDYHTVGLRADGTVVATGSNVSRQCDVSGWTDIVAVDVGSAHTVGLRSDGTVVATGDNKWGQCDVSGWTDIRAVAAGNFHTIGLRSDGTVVATGWNNYGQCDVSDWTDIVAVAAGNVHTVGLRSDGTVVAIGENGKGQCDVSGWTNIKLPE